MPWISTLRPSYLLGMAETGPQHDIPTDRRPIGYWVRLLDRLLDDDLAATLEPEGLTRRSWQVLNLLRASPRGAEGVAAAVRPFISDQAEIDVVIDSLIAQGLVERDREIVQLTAAGTAELGRVLRLVSQRRAQMMENIEGEQYLATIAALMQMAKNLGWREDDPDVR